MKLKSLVGADFSIKRLMIALVTIPLLVYLALGLAAYFFADRLIFRPPPPHYRDGAEIVKLATPSGAQVSARLFRNEGARMTILFSHGNAEDIGGSAAFFEALAGAGFDVFAYDYRGYGTSGGVPSERAAYEDADAAYRYLTEERGVAPARIVLHGRSLGAAVAIDLAARRECGGLIAESAFVSAFRVPFDFPVFPFDEFDNLAKIGAVRCPVLFIHGERDALIPVAHGRRLFAAARGPKRFFAVPGAGHNDVSLVAGNEYYQTIRDFAANLPQ